MSINKVLFTFIKIAFSVMILLLVITAAVRICRIGYDYGFRLYTEPAMEEAPGKDVMVQVKTDMSNRELSELLEEKHLIRDSKLFYVQLFLSGYRKKIAPGVYTLNTSMEPKELMVAMAPEEETEGTEDSEAVEEKPDLDEEDSENPGDTETEE